MLAYYQTGHYYHTRRIGDGLLTETLKSAGPGPQMENGFAVQCTHVTELNIFVLRFLDT